MSAIPAGRCFAVVERYVLDAIGELADEDRAGSIDGDGDRTHRREVAGPIATAARTDGRMTEVDATARLRRIVMSTALERDSVQSWTSRKLTRGRPGVCPHSQAGLRARRSRFDWFAGV